MRTKILAAFFGSEGRKKVLRAILDHPDKGWAVSELEKTTEAPHATIWRTIADLEKAKVLRSWTLGRKIRCTG